MKPSAYVTKDGFYVALFREGILAWGWEVTDPIRDDEGHRIRPPMTTASGHATFRTKRGAIHECRKALHAARKELANDRQMIAGVDAGKTYTHLGEELDW